MKAKDLLRDIGGALFLCAALTACRTTAPQTDNRPRFYESASANVVLRFNRWDTIHLLRPDSRQGGFLPILTRADIDRELKTQRVGHELAVVVFGFLFPPDVEAQYVREWVAFLSAHGFARVVVLRTGAAKDFDGLLVAHDSGIGGGHDRTAVAATKAPALPPPVGANAPNPSGRRGR